MQKYVKRSRDCIVHKERLTQSNYRKTALSLEIQVDPDILLVDLEGNNKRKTHSIH